jgi:thermitase
MKRTVAWTIGMGALVWASSLPTPAAAQEPPPRWVEGQAIAKFGAAASGAAITNGVTQAGGIVKKKMAASGGSLVLVQFSPDTTTLDEVLTRLRANTKVVYAEPNYIIPIAWPFRPWLPHGGTMLRMRSGTDADGRPTFYETSRRDVLAGTSFPAENPALDRWGWLYGGAGVSWASAETAPPVTLIDTGVDYRHPDLKKAILSGPDVLEGDGNPMDDNGHGTHMAGIIAARLNNGVGISGISRGEVLAIKAFDRAGLGSHYDIARALYQAAAAAPKLVVIGGSGPDESLTLREAVNQAVNKSGKLLIAPAGDAGSNAPYYPAAYANWATPARPITFVDRVVAVSAEGASVTASGGGEAFVEYCQAPFANYGSWVSIVAPGVDIYSTTPFGRDFYYRAYGGSTTGYDSFNGTSMAAAYVAGTAARQLSVASGSNTLNVARRLVGSGGLPSLEAYTGAVDVDSDGIDELAGCWDPTWAKAGPGRALDLAEANVGMAMGRSAIWGYVDGALDGASIPGLYGIVLNWGYPNLRRQGAPIPAGGYQYEILDVKWFDKQYQIRVRKDGITNGPAGVGTIKIDQWAIWKEFDYLSLPPPGNWSIVTTWGNPHFGASDLDQHVIFPLAGTGRCDIGPTDPGLATNPAEWCGAGSTAAPPWVNYAYSRSGTGRNVQTTVIKKPLYSTEREPYRIFLKEFNQGADLNDPVRGWPTMRIWIGGIVKREVRFGHDTLVQTSPACSIEGGTEDCSVWHVGDLLSASTFTFNPKNELGDGVNSAYVP